MPSIKELIILIILNIITFVFLVSYHINETKKTEQLLDCLKIHSSKVCGEYYAKD